MVNLKNILNLSKGTTYLKLKGVCEKHGAIIFSKIRLADILPIEKSGISDLEYRFALQAHFDFVVADEKYKPLFVVEFDGPLHTTTKQQTRDITKNDLCVKFELPILRINSNYLKKVYREMDILSWFVEAWFAWVWFEEAQAKGDIAWDETFMPFMMVNVSDYNRQFPLWLSAPVLKKIQKLCFSRTIEDLAPSIIIGKGEDGTCRAISYIRISKENGIVVDTAMRGQNFPISEADALDEIVIFQLYERLIETLNGKEKMIPLEDIASTIQEFKKKYEIRRAFICGSSATQKDVLTNEY